MISGDILSKTDFTRKSVKDDVVKEAVSFLLNRDNITTISWSNVDCVLSKDETVVSPQITRRATRKVLLERYCESKSDGDCQYLNKQVCTR